MDRTLTAVGIVLAAIIVVIAAIVAVPGLSAAVFPSHASPAESSGPVTVYFFYGEECPHCHEVRPVIDSLQKKYPDVEFLVLETWHNQTNAALAATLNQDLGVTRPGVPEVIVGNTVLFGAAEIPEKLEQVILAKKKP